MFAEKTTLLPNDIEREKDINERRNAIEEELRSIDDEDAFASPMDCDNYEAPFCWLVATSQFQEC